MIISTQHLLLVKEAQPPTVAPAIADAPMVPVNPEESKADTSVKENESVTSGQADPVVAKGDPSDVDIEMQDADQTPKEEVKEVSVPEQPADEPSAVLPAATIQSPELTHPSYDPTFGYPGGYPLDLEFEASKLPLDVAVFNSTRACNGGDEKIRKYLQAVLVVGGTSLIPGMAHALESR
jgi:actin-related protein 8